MIKSSTPDIDKLAEAHYLKLKINLLDKIDNGVNYISKINKPALTDFNKRCLRIYLKYILTAKPEDLLKLYDLFEKHFPGINYQKVFDYDWFSSKTRKYGTYELAQKLNIRVCLYCNRSYTITVTSNNKNKFTRPQFDHFHYKNKYSLLALSFYNLIPSCNICNSNLKGDVDFEGINPYTDNLIDQFKFKSIPLNITTLLNVNDEFDIQVIKSNPTDVDVNRKIDKTIETFKLKEIYKAHGNEIKDLYFLRYKYSQKYLEELSKMTKNKFSEEELFRLAFGTEIEESKFTNRPLSKLKKDILIELGIIKKV